LIKLICKDCNQVWYTANTKPDQKCSYCGGALQEVKLILDEDTEKNSNGAKKKKR
jgi:rRNA maturation endonuclease Nob1